MRIHVIDHAGTRIAALARLSQVEINKLINHIGRTTTVEQGDRVIIKVEVEAGEIWHAQSESK